MLPNAGGKCTPAVMICISRPGSGRALLLKERSEELCGTIKFIFQPGEEDARGAMKILETDVMDDVERIWGFHADPTNEVGVIGIREGYVTAAVDRFGIRVKGDRLSWRPPR